LKSVERSGSNEATAKKGEPVIEGIAINGQGVFDTLKEHSKMVLAELKKGN